MVAVAHISTVWAQQPLTFKSKQLSKTYEDGGDRVEEEKTMITVNAAGHSDTLPLTTFKTTFKNDKRTSKKIYGPTGMLVKEIMYQDDGTELHRTYYPFEENIQTEAIYKGGKRHGEEKRFNKDESVSEILHFAGDKLHGEWVSYNYKTHHLVRQELYNHGNKDGEQKYFDPETGKPTGVELYKSGKWIESKVFDPDGNIQIFKDEADYRAFRNEQFKKLFAKEKNKGVNLFFSWLKTGTVPDRGTG